MKRIAVLALAALGVGLASPAIADAAPATTCAATVARFERTERVAFGTAGSPPVVCQPGPFADGTAGGSWDGSTILIAPWSPGLGGTARGYYRTTIAHEVGHAYARTHGIDVAISLYARVRGFAPEADQATVNEDYAETFALAVGWWSADPVPAAPYDFLAGAGVPSAHQLHALRAAGLLPR